MKKGVKFQIRPYPASREKLLLMPGGGLALSGEQQLDKFIHCLVGWQGIEDENGSPIELTEEVKKVVFDNRLEDIPSFVAEKINEMEAEREAEAKNS